MTNTFFAGVFDDLFSDLSGGFGHTIYTINVGKRNEFTVQVPGYGKEDLRLTVNGSELELVAPNGKGKLAIIKTDRVINPNDVVASVKNGLLTIRLSKEPDGPTEIKID